MGLERGQCYQLDGRWEFGLWMIIDTLVGFCGWAVFGTCWNGVRNGFRRLLQVSLAGFVLCGALHLGRVLPSGFHRCGDLDGGDLGVEADVENMRMVGTLFFHVQRVLGMAPEEADVEYMGPGMDVTLETATLRAFKRSGENQKLVVVRQAGLDICSMLALASCLQ